MEIIDMSNKDKTNFERIAAYLMYEACPKTPHEISKWTGIDLGDVYFTLQNNGAFFREILDGDSLKGWTVDNI